MKQLKITWQERVVGSQRDGNSQHCEFKKLEDEKSHYLRKIVMLSRVAKRKKTTIRTSISSITVGRRRRKGGFMYTA